MLFLPVVWRNTAYLSLSLRIAVCFFMAAEAVRVTNLSFAVHRRAVLPALPRRARRRQAGADARVAAHGLRHPALVLVSRRLMVILGVGDAAAAIVRSKGQAQVASLEQDIHETRLPQTDR